MASIYFNGTEIDEVDDDVYFNGTPLAIGKSVYLNGTIVWTKQAGCTTFSSGTTYTHWDESGSASSTGTWTVEGATGTVDSGVCASSTCSVRAGSKGLSDGESGYSTGGGRVKQNGTVVVTYSNGSGTGSLKWSSYVTRTINAGDTFVLEGLTSYIGVSHRAYGQVKSATSGTMITTS
jgi:hypothetical protein